MQRGTHQERGTIHHGQTIDLADDGMSLASFARVYSPESKVARLHSTLRNSTSQKTGICLNHITDSRIFVLHQNQYHPSAAPRSRSSAFMKSQNRDEMKGWKGGRRKGEATLWIAIGVDRTLQPTLPAFGVFHYRSL
eukprot:310173-Rhodomonas_salina.1